MNRKTIEAFEHAGDFKLENTIWKGQPAKVSRYCDMKTGQAFDIHVPTNRYRKTPVPPSRDDIGCFEEKWLEFAP